MDRAGVGTALGLLVLESVEFAQHLDGDVEVVVFETVQAVRVVQKDVGIEHEVLHQSHGGGPSGTPGWWKKERLFFGGFERCGEVHGGVQAVVGVEVSP